MPTPDATTREPNFWVVRAGAGGEFVHIFVQKDYVAIGWDVGGSLEEFDDPHALHSALQEALPDATPMAISMTRGQLWRFANEFAIGDVVLTVDAVKRKVHAGRLSGDYAFTPGGDADCPFEHRRNVTWTHVFDRDELSVKLKYALGALMTVFNVNHHQQELRALMEMAPAERKRRGPSVAELQKQTREAVLSRLTEMDGQQFEHFVRHVLDVVGFEQTDVTAYAGDRGVDVVGILNARNLASINLKVQVKRQSGSVGVTTVNALRGTLAYEEHGLIIATSRFTGAAMKAAEAPGLKRIALIDGAALVDLITDVYDDLDEQYRERLGLQRVLVPGPPGLGSRE